MRRAVPTLFMLVVLAVGCGSSAKPTVSGTTTVTTAAPVTTTTEPTAPNIIGTGDLPVQNRLRDAATAEFTLYTDAQAFTADLATLTSVEPTITYGAGLSPPANPNVVNVAVSADRQWACLTGRSALGRVFVYGLVTNQGAMSYEGNAPLSVCSAATVRAMQPANG